MAHFGLTYTRIRSCEVGLTLTDMRSHRSECRESPEGGVLSASANCSVCMSTYRHTASPRRSSRSAERLSPDSIRRFHRPQGRSVHRYGRRYRSHFSLVFVTPHSTQLHALLQSCLPRFVLGDYVVRHGAYGVHLFRHLTFPSQQPCLHFLLRTQVPERFLLLFDHVWFSFVLLCSPLF